MEKVTRIFALIETKSKRRSKKEKFISNRLLINFLSSNFSQRSRITFRFLLLWRNRNKIRKQFFRILSIATNRWILWFTFSTVAFGMFLSKDRLMIEWKTNHWKDKHDFCSTVRRQGDHSLRVSTALKDFFVFESYKTFPRFDDDEFLSLTKM